MSLIRLTIALALSLALAISLGAQAPVQPGTRVRVLKAADSLAVTPSAPSTDAWRVGIVMSSTPQVLLLKPAPLSEPIVFQMREIRRIDISRGRPNRKWSGAAIGGLLSGAAFVGLACAFSDGSCSVHDNVGGFLGYYAAGAIPGAIVGGALGARRHGPERWEQVYHASRAATAPSVRTRD